MSNLNNVLCIENGQNADLSLLQKDNLTDGGLSQLLDYNAEMESCRNRKTGHQICKFRKCEELKKKPGSSLERTPVSSGEAFRWFF
ncbi:CXXC-type zinc finger protein 4 isoform X2 [Nelusetta ayraudi]|uniref:CXXC-type zinc finger protein 4 isoform X2 n=1 Tax=Nelusetta ayraudi TaxID=303726 RepID=UPI003F71A5CA